MGGQVLAWGWLGPAGAASAVTGVYQELSGLWVGGLSWASVLGGAILTFRSTTTKHPGENDGQDSLRVLLKESAPGPPKGYPDREILVRAYGGEC